MVYGQAIERIMSLTLISYTHGDDLKPCLAAMRRSWDPHIMSEAVLICVDGGVKPVTEHEKMPLRFESVPPPTGRSGYNRFILGRIHNYIKTSHFLLVHPDGFVVNWHKWTPKFLDYDYIGAPWFSGGAGGEKWRVGNGGFTLRSVALMKKVSEVWAPLCQRWIEQPIEERGEDAFICHNIRDTLEASGFKFAPVALAAQFSIESRLPDLPCGPSDSFGFHGRCTDWTARHCELNRP